jgi:hypothetical protein
MNLRRDERTLVNLTACRTKTRVFTAVNPSLMEADRRMLHRVVQIILTLPCGFSSRVNELP